MRPFIYNALPARVVFGSGTLSRLPEEVARLGCSRALVLSTKVQEQSGKEVQQLLGSSAVGLYSNATMHTPETITEEAMKLARELKADCVVSVGGGSTIGLGKAIAYRTDLPQIVVPTTYAGSEATPILGQTAGGQKTTLKSDKGIPFPTLSLSIPLLSFTRGFLSLLTDSPSGSHSIRRRLNLDTPRANDSNLRHERNSPRRRSTLLSGIKSHDRHARRTRHRSYRPRPPCHSQGTPQQGR